MKRLLLVLTFLSCVTAIAETGPVSCYKAADRYLSLDKIQTVTLCAGAKSTEPIDCYKEADRHLSLTKEEMVRLCAAKAGS